MKNLANDQILNWVEFYYFLGNFVAKIVGKTFLWSALGAAAGGIYFLLVGEFYRGGLASFYALLTGFMIWGWPEED